MNKICLAADLITFPPGASISSAKSTSSLKRCTTCPVFVGVSLSVYGVSVVWTATYLPDAGLEFLASKLLPNANSPRVLICSIAKSVANNSSSISLSSVLASR